MIYLDNASTTPIRTTVLAEMMPYYEELFGNPGSLCELGRQAKGAVEDARIKVAEFMGTTPEHIIFTSGGSEGNNLVLRGLAPYLRERSKSRVVRSSIEHDSVRRCLGEMNHREYYVSNYDFSFNWTEMLENLEKEVTPYTGLVTTMYVNNETGYRMPVKMINELCRDRGILFHTDAVQAAGFFPLDAETMCDFMTISSHKIHGPKGVGAIYVRDPSMLSPIISGGEDQEFGLRSGTENVAGIVGFGEACRIAGSNLRRSRDTVEELVKLFLTTLATELHVESYRPNTAHLMPRDNGTGFALNIDDGEIDLLCRRILSIQFVGVDAQTLVLMLDSKSVCVSAGSACRSHNSKPNASLVAMGYSEQEAGSSIRVSFSELNTDDEVVYAARAIADCVKALRANA